MLNKNQITALIKEKESQEKALTQKLIKLHKEKLVMLEEPGGFYNWDALAYDGILEVRDLLTITTIEKDMLRRMLTVTEAEVKFILKARLGEAQRYITHLNAISGDDILEKITVDAEIVILTKVLLGV